MHPQDAPPSWLHPALPITHGSFLLMFSASLILIIGQYTDLDLQLADVYFDAGQQRFPWNTNWFATTFMHEWVKALILWSGKALIAITALDLLLRFQRISPLRRTQLQVLSLSAIFEPMVVRLLKGRSALHCPWGVDRYHGNTPFLRLLDSVPPDWLAGNCFPAGHASAGMWLGAIAVFWLPHSPRKALLAYLAGTSIGLVMGWVQQMRGQHFLTHTLWTAWIAGAVLLLLLAAYSRRLISPAN